MATPTPFSALQLSSNSWQVPNVLAQKQAAGPLPGAMNPFWGTSQPSQSQAAATSQHVQSQLAASLAPSTYTVAGTRLTMDIAGQFCLGLGMLLAILLHH